MVSLQDLKLADATIEGFRTDSGDLIVDIRDWQERMLVLRFEDVVALEASSALGAEISHATESTDDPWLAEMVRRGEEEQERYRCFSFHSGWDGSVVLRIVARSVSQDVKAVP